MRSPGTLHVYSRVIENGLLKYKYSLLLKIIFVCKFLYIILVLLYILSLISGYVYVEKLKKLVSKKTFIEASKVVNFKCYNVTFVYALIY